MTIGNGLSLGLGLGLTLGKSEILTTYTLAGQTAASETATGFAAWVNPSNALADDSSFATNTLGGLGDSNTENLNVTNLNLSSTAALSYLTPIRGLNVKVRRFRDTAAENVVDFRVQLRDASGLIGPNKNNASSVWETTETEVIYNWTEAELTAAGYEVLDDIGSDFGLAFAASIGIGFNEVDISVDSITFDLVLGEPPVTPLEAGLADSWIANDFVLGLREDRASSVKLAIIGDSISNPGTNVSGDSGQSSYYHAITRTWEVNWNSIILPYNAALSNFFLSNGANVTTNVISMATGSRTTANGDTNFSPKPVYQIIAAATPVANRICSIDIQDTNATYWASGTPPWYDAQLLSCEYIYYSTTGSFTDANSFSRYVNPSGANSTADDNNNDFSAASAGAQIVTKFTAAEPASVFNGGERNHFINMNMPGSAGNEEWILMGAEISLRGGSGFGLDACGVGGARLNDFSDTTELCNAANWNAYFGSSVTGATHFMIALGANDGTWDNTDRTAMETLIERCHGANNDCKILLVTPYGTENSITQEAALNMADILYQIQQRGTANVDSNRIAFLNTPKILGNTLDNVGPTGLVDNIHPSRLDIDLIANDFWTNRIVPAAYTDVEDGLTLTSSFAAGAIASTNFNRSAPCVMACNLIVPASAPDGCIFELGAPTSGAYVGFTSGELLIRCGNGGALPNNEAAWASIDMSAYLGKRISLVWEFDAFNDTMRAWINGTLVADEVASSTFNLNIWAGSNDGGYGQVGGSNQATGVDTSNFNGTLLTNLRYYENQTV